jgi:ParB family chromosome partitioning protein
MTRKVLGRGLSALTPNIPTPPPITVLAPAAVPTGEQRNGETNGTSSSSRDFFLCPITDIAPDPTQPRHNFDDERLDELAQSIRQVGVLQPLIVRRTTQGANGYILVAGERRWRAAQRAGLHRIPVVIRDLEQLHTLEVALIENLQRADLNAIEEAEAYQRLTDDHGYTQAQLGERLGRDRATIANALRLLDLPEIVQKSVMLGKISAGHARSLLPLEKVPLMVQLMERIIQQQLSVRQTETLVKQYRSDDSAPGTVEEKISPNVRDLQERLCQALKTRVALRSGRGQSGRLEIHYGSLDELDRLLKVLLP